MVAVVVAVWVAVWVVVVVAVWVVVAVAVVVAVVVAVWVAVWVVVAVAVAVVVAVNFKIEEYMKTIIAGSRTITDFLFVEQAIKESGFDITEVISGTAIGVDRIGEQWAVRNNIPVKMFKPRWDLYSKKAGIIRNMEMVEYSEALVAIWDGKSKGTKHTIDYSRDKGLKVFVKVMPVMP